MTTRTARVRDGVAATTDGPFLEAKEHLVGYFLVECEGPERAAEIAALIRHHGGFDACEDALQEALLAAALQWPEQGVPANPPGWLLTVAGRRLADERRSDWARRRREATAAARVPSEDQLAPAADIEDLAAKDDTLTLLFLCCTPSART